MNFKISIITINYNNKLGLQKTIDSVFAQSYTNFEFIVVDGNSTDGSKELLELHRAKFTRLVIEPDSGIYNAMNKGIRMARGEFLLFLNSGDCLATQDILATIEPLLEANHDIFYADIIWEELKKQRKVVFPERLTFNFFHHDNLSHQASFIRKTLFEEIFYYNEDYKIAADWEFLIYAICKMNVSYKHLNIVTTIYDGNGLSSNTANYQVLYQERNETLQKYFPAFISDYSQLSLLNDKRVKQLLTIKKNDVAFKILKALLKAILFFLPKQAQND